MLLLHSFCSAYRTTKGRCRRSIG